MNQAEYLADNPYATFGMIAADAPADARLSFIRKTYTHLAAAVYALVMLEFLIFYTMDVEPLAQFMFRGWNWLFVILAFGVVSGIADKWARSNTSIGMQYAGLCLYVVAEAFILCPLLWIANHFTTPIGGAEYSPILVAAVVTLAVFGVLTATVFITRHDFSYLGPMLGIAFVVLIGVAILGAFGVMSIGVWLMSAFAVFACGYILYSTSNVLHHYRTEQHVAASLALFASVALLFWYVLQIVIALSGRD